MQGCIVTLPDFNPVRSEQINTTALFGLGYIDQLPGKAIVQNNRSNMFANIVKEFNLDFDAIGSGRPHILPDGRVGKFGWKAQFATLEEFVASACANELGLGNPSAAQATPIGSSLKADNSDLSSEQVKAMNAFVTMLPKPTVVWPTQASALASAQRGEQLFEQIGCAVCHVKNLAGVDGVYSDFLLHRIQDARKVGPYLLDQLREVPRDERQPAPEEWKTPPLWGVADSAPYMHDGSSPTLRSAILQHAGDANSVTRAFKKLEPREQEALIDFLNTLRAPQTLSRSSDLQVKSTSPLVDAGNWLGARSSSLTLPALLSWALLPSPVPSEARSDLSPNTPFTVDDHRQRGEVDSDAHHARTVGRTNKYLSTLPTSQSRGRSPKTPLPARCGNSQ